MGEDDVLAALRELGADDKWVFRSAVVARLLTSGCSTAEADALLDQMTEAGTVRLHPMEWNSATPRIRLP